MTMLCVDDEGGEWKEMCGRVAVLAAPNHQIISLERVGFQVRTHWTEAKSAWTGVRGRVRTWKPAGAMCKRVDG
jgi:hypothetical protein